jgi:hypothetical protein
MSAPTRELRLGPLPRAEVVKLPFACSTGLKADLDLYAALHAQAYGEAIEAARSSRKGSEGLPFVIDSFTLYGRGRIEDSFDPTVPRRLAARPSANANELSLDSDIVGFSQRQDHREPMPD